MTDRTTAIGWSRLGRLLLLGTAAALLSTATAWAQFPNDFKFGDSEDFTIGLWLNSDVTQSTDVSLLSNKDWGSGNNVGYVMTLDDNGSGGNEWKVNVDTTGDVRADTAWTTVDLSNWHFVVATFNRATQEVTAYTDGGGALTAALAAGSIDTWSDTPGLGLDMNIAQDGTGQYAGGQSYNGLMDDVAVWNRVLTASEINYLYSQGLAGHDLGSLFGTTAPGAGSTINTGLTALYDFEGNTNDVSGSPNVNNGVWKAGNGGTTGTFGSSRTGFGNAADFDGLSFITIGESADAVLVDWTGNSAANNNFNNPGNWTSDPSGWTAGTQINIGAGTSSFGDAPGAQSGPALLHNGDNFSVGVATFGADGQTTFVDMSNGTLYADGNDDSTIGPANSTVSLRMTDATMNVRTGAEEGAELDVAKDGSTVNLTASGTSRLAAGNLVPDANFATGYRRPVAADGVARVGDDIKFGNGGTLTATLGGNTEVFAPDVFYVNDSAGGSTEVVQNDNSKVIANWDTRWFDTDSHTSDQVVNWTLNDNSEFRVARDHGLGETAGDGTINVTVNDNATFFAGDRIVIGADGGNVNVVLNGGLMKVGGNSETDKLYVDETGAPTDNDPLNQPLAIDWILHMGGGASANLDVNGGTAEIGRSAYIGRGGGTAQVTVNAGSFNVLGVGPDGTGLGNAPGGGVAGGTDWTGDFGGGEVVLGFDVGDTGSFTHSGGAVNVDRGFIVGFGGTGQLVLAGSSGTVPTPSFNVGGDLSFGAAQFAQLGTGSLVARLNANPITPVSVNGTNSDGFFFGDLVINDGSEFSLQVADGFRPHFGPNQGTETLVNYVGTRTGDGTAKFTEVAARAEWGIDYSLVYDNAGKKVDVNLDYVFAAGDTDFDKDFDTTDRNNMAAKFNAGPVGATFSQGDFNNDEQVDLADAQLALGSGVYNAGPYEGLTPPTTPIGMATLTYDVLTGNLSLDADGNTLSSFRILSQSDAFTAASASLPAGTFSTDADGEIGVAFAAITGTTDLGDVVGLPGPGDPLADLLFTYTVAGVAGIFQGDILLAGGAAGDANGDGWVDGLDYLVWAANFDTVGPPDPAVADGNFNGDSAVDGLDYLVWASNFGSHSAATAVPEPSAAMLVSLAALATAVLPVRRRVAERV